MADWKTDKQVPSCAHGSACSQGWQGAVELGAWASSPATGRRPRLQTALAAAASAVRQEVTNRVIRGAGGTVRTAVRARRASTKELR